MNFGNGQQMVPLNMTKMVELLLVKKKIIKFIF